MCWCVCVWCRYLVIDTHDVCEGVFVRWCFVCWCVCVCVWCTYLVIDAHGAVRRDHSPACKSARHRDTKQQRFRVRGKHLCVCVCVCVCTRDIGG